MKSWEEIISEAKSKKERDLEDRVSELDDMPSSLKKNKDKKKDKDKEKSAYTKYLNRQLKFKTKKYEEQKKKELENIRKKAGQKNLEKAKSALRGIKTDTISHKENEASAYQKAVGNVASLAGGLASAGYHGVRSIMDKKAAEKRAEERRSKQLEKKEQGIPGRRKREEPSQPSPEMKKITGGPDRKRLMPAPSSDMATGMSLGQRARRNPELKKRLIASRNEEYSNWKEEFIIEIDDKKTKYKEKIIDILKGKNSIEINPQITEDHKEIASGKKKDDEGYMANVELDQMERAIKALRKKLKKSDTQLPAWVQSKITRAADYVDTASEYLQSDEKIDEECGCDTTMKLIKLAREKKQKKNSQLNLGIIGEKAELWQTKKGQRESGGLNAAGVASYRRNNPGSKLKTAVTTKPSKLKKNSKSWKRRKSFCARMLGMKKRLTSAKTAKDPNSRINKSLRAWNC